MKRGENDKSYLADSLNMVLDDMNQPALSAEERESLLTAEGVARHAALRRLAERTPTGNSLDTKADRRVQNPTLTAFERQLAAQIAHVRCNRLN